MPAVNRIGESKLVFGTTDEPFGFVQAVSEEIDHKKLAEQRGNGSTAAVEYYDRQHKISGTYTFFVGNGTGPMHHVCDGNTITLQDVGLAIYIEKATRNWTRAGWTNVSFEGIHYPFLGS